MNDNNTINEQDAELSHNAVSLYASDTGDDFPVLKAFQQYIDAEQAKARKRLLMMGVFFCVLMFTVIAVFVALLMTVSERNQALNDRLVEFAMKERDRIPAAPVVVQPNNDGSAVLSLTQKLEEMQRQIAESQRLMENQQSKTLAQKSKQLTSEEIEIQRLRALLDVEKQKAAAEKERKHQEEIEAYRRKHYPELYQDEFDDDEDYIPRRKRTRSPSSVKRPASTRRQETSDAISYFDEDDFDEEDLDLPEETPATKKSSPSGNNELPESPKSSTEDEKKYSIPVDTRKSSISWRIPE